MALEFAHGSIQWLSADAINTTYTVSGLSFQPKAIRFYTSGQNTSTDDDADSLLDVNRCVGFAVSTSSRRAVTGFLNESADPTDCWTYARNDACVIFVSASIITGALDLNAINSDGFQLIIDDGVPSNIAVFWEAWGGSDITVAAVGDLTEPSATGTQNYTVTGFTSGATDQVVMLAGVQATSFNATAQQDSGFYAGYATSTAAADQIVLGGNNDDGSANTDADGYCQSGECVMMFPVAGGNPNARASLSAFGTNQFTLNWAERGVTGRISIFMAIKGGNWKAGEFTINSTAVNNTATVSGLAFTPIGVCLMSRMSAESTADTSQAGDKFAMGTGSSTSSRRSMGYFVEDGTGSRQVNSAIEYDQVLCMGDSNAPTSQPGAAYDINAMNSDGFQIIVDRVGTTETGVSNEWIGYFTFGNPPGSVGSASGTGTATGVGASTAASTASASGTGTATGVGASTAASTAEASGTGTATAVGSAVTAADGSASGTGTATGVGASTAASTAEASGTGTATGVGASTAASDAVAAGTGTATGVGASTAASTAEASGTGTATAVGTGINQADGSASGTGTATAVGTAVTAAVASASGTGAASAVGEAMAAAEGTASASGTATVVAIGASIAAAVASASGTGTASATGEDASAGADDGEPYFMLRRRRAR